MESRWDFVRDDRFTFSMSSSLTQMRLRISLSGHQSYSFTSDITYKSHFTGLPNLFVYSTWDMQSPKVPVTYKSSKRVSPTPASSNVSRLAACSAVSSISHPPFGRTHSSCEWWDDMSRIDLSRIGTHLKRTLIPFFLPYY